MELCLHFEGNLCKRKGPSICSRAFRSAFLFPVTPAPALAIQIDNVRAYAKGGEQTNKII